MKLLKDLGNLIDINYFESGEGAVNIFVANGKPLVVGSDTWNLYVREDPATGCYDVIFKSSTDPGENLNDVLSGKRKGKIGGLIEARDDTIHDYLDKLDELAQNIITKVNEQHKKGFDAYNRAGGDFFVPAGADHIARDMALTDDLAGESNKIAASATVAGEGDNARSIGNLKDDLSMSGNRATFGDFYGALVSRVGQDSADAKRMVEHQSAIMDNLVSQREGVSGVSLDEEMINLTKYQMGYNAAARLCTTADKMLEVLMNLGN
jgi:flagellar hook-associated protein 1 FlgK